jgi:hypothetical protein
MGTFWPFSSSQSVSNEPIQVPFRSGLLNRCFRMGHFQPQRKKNAQKSPKVVTIILSCRIASSDSISISNSTITRTQINIVATAVTFMILLRSSCFTKLKSPQSNSVAERLHYTHREEGIFEEILSDYYCLHTDFAERIDLLIAHESLFGTYSYQWFSEDAFSSRC